MMRRLGNQQTIERVRVRPGQDAARIDRPHADPQNRDPLRRTRISWPNPKPLPSALAIAWR